MGVRDWPLLIEEANDGSYSLRGRLPEQLAAIVRADERRKVWLEAIGLVELERNSAVMEGCEPCAIAANRILARLRAKAEGRE